jgi:hypothetical protein
MPEDEIPSVVEDECDTEPIHPDEKYLSHEKSPEHLRRDVRQYMGIEIPEETITHLERMTTEAVYGKRYDVWDVITDKNRWWVITNLLNFYSQSMFPSMDMCLTFHIGLMARMMGTDVEPDEVGQSLLKTGRKLDAASQALEQACEAEDFQAVGMKLREGLLTFIREFADAKIVPKGAEQPKVGDFIHWSEFIAEWVTPTKNLRSMRKLLKAFAKDLWQAVNSLTHTTSADGTEAAFCVAGSHHLIGQFANLIRSLEEEPTERCPKCDSMQLFREYRVDGDRGAYFVLCEKCGWERGPEETE